jgi:hypothetical protein
VKAAEARAESEANERRCETLSAEQERVLVELKRGANVFFTGCGGTGKSLTLKSALASLRELYGDDFERRVAVTAPTGIAASHIGGTTINLAAGVGLPKTHGDFNRVFGYRARQERAQRQEGRGAPPVRQFRGVDFRALEVLVVDEVSMLSGEFFDALDAAVTKMRGGAAKKNAERSRQACAGVPGAVDPFVAFPDALREGESTVLLCQAWQRLSLAKSLHGRLGVESALSLLPRNAQGGGDLHEPIARYFAAASGCFAECSGGAMVVKKQTQQMKKGVAVGEEEQEEDNYDEEEGWEGQERESQHAAGDAPSNAGQQSTAPVAEWQEATSKKRASLRVRRRVERTSRRWLVTEIEGGADIARRTHFKSLAFGGIQLLFSGDFFQVSTSWSHFRCTESDTRICQLLVTSSVATTAVTARQNPF